MELIKIGKNKGNATMLISYSIADKLGVSKGDQINIKLEHGSISIYKLWDMDVEDGYKVSKRHDGNGLIVRHNDLNQYFEIGERYQVDFEPYYHDVLEKDLFELTKIQDGSRDKD